VRPLAQFGIFLVLACGVGATFAAPAPEPELGKFKLATDNFGADAPWYLRNIPFFEIDDRRIQQIYYYRWKVFRSHVREIGAEGTTVLEFLDNVPWARQPFTDLNDSAAFHIAEGRWLRDPRIVENLIDHLYSGGANDRHFSESIAAATQAFTRVTGDPSPGLRHLQQMQRIFDQWNDHLDASRGLYWVEPLLDATEYTIASIDASGAGFMASPSTDQNHNGFTGGWAFRPSINSYQYANALAIAHFAELAGNTAMAADFMQRAATIQAAVLEQLWNPSLRHFVDRYQRSSQFVQAGDFIRGRELVGYTPWLVELPPGTGAYADAWVHLLDPHEFAGPHGLRTVEPAYPRYLQQYRYDKESGNPECQWNGPSWPFQTSQVLTAMANVLDDYSQIVVTGADYLRLLRQFTQQHVGASGQPDIEEDYDPDTGRPIVGLARSHHYFHSTYVDLIIGGLIGVRPRSDDVLEIAPLGQDVRYFALQRLMIHGHNVGIYYDASGERYGIGRGMSVYVDGQLRYGPGEPVRLELPLSAKHRLRAHDPQRRFDYAVNVGLAEGPAADASSPGEAPSMISQAIDGRMWFFASNPNGWTPDLDGSRTSWYSVDFKQPRTLSSVELYFFADGTNYRAPPAYRIERRMPAGWREIQSQRRVPLQPIGNGENVVTFPAVSTRALRIVFTNPRPPLEFRLIELKAFGPSRAAPVDQCTKGQSSLVQPNRLIPKVGVPPFAPS
jgi:hypothetical protein